MNDLRQSAGCQRSATIELYFYGEVTAAERAAVERHLSRCVDCRLALEELTVIRRVLESRPDVCAPPASDWSGFVARLQDALRAETRQQSVGAGARVGTFPSRRRVAVALAMAALVMLVTMSVLVVVRDRGGTSGGENLRAGEIAVPAVPRAPEASRPPAPDALERASGQHFERSKLVLLGLATKDPAESTAADWNYERTLATALLDDTRLYRQAADARGMKTLSNVMRDLELVLLQTSMAQEPDAESLAQLQRLIRRRDLLTKMDVVTTSRGIAPGP